jgi:hypothetical protein
VTAEKNHQHKKLKPLNEILLNLMSKPKYENPNRNQNKEEKNHIKFSSAYNVFLVNT